LTEADLSIGTNEHRNKTWNQTTLHKTTNNTTSHSDNEITKKKSLMWKSLIWL